MCGKLTSSVFYDLHLGSVRWCTRSCFVNSNNAELIFSAFLEIFYASLQSITWNLTGLLPIGLVFVFLLDNIFLNGSSTITGWRRPFEVDSLVVIVSDFWSSRLTRFIYRKY